ALGAGYTGIRRVGALLSAHGLAYGGRDIVRRNSGMGNERRILLFQGFPFCGRPLCRPVVQAVLLSFPVYIPLRLLDAVLERRAGVRRLEVFLSALRRSVRAVYEPL